MSEAISTTRPQTPQGWRRTALWAVKILVALAFLAAGLAKLAGVQTMIDIFNVIGLGQWFRYGTGAIEVTGAILMLIPSLAVFSALLLACTMVGAVITHLTVLPASPIPALILFALSAAIAWVHRDQVVNLLPKNDADRN
ncbi:DoxX family protein [Cupriavidus necator]|uniref:DoxX family protein n=1 Tax=Cupriavidus necator TaxID=106590 RepID=UPI00068F2328|nr:DoxX family protein [Cupriavidus necator]